MSENDPANFDDCVYCVLYLSPILLSVKSMLALHLSPRFSFTSIWKHGDKLQGMPLHPTMALSVMSIIKD